MQLKMFHTTRSLEMKPVLLHIAAASRPACTVDQRVRGDICLHPVVKRVSSLVLGVSRNINHGNNDTIRLTFRGPMSHYDRRWYGIYLPLLIRQEFRSVIMLVLTHIYVKGPLVECYHFDGQDPEGLAGLVVTSEASNRSMMTHSLQFALGTEETLATL